jgi:lipopolysaccharide export system protein LptA
MNPRSLLSFLVVAGALLLAACAPARAEKADRDKPVNLEADRVTVDDKNKVYVFDGHATLTQGTLLIRADKIVVTQDLEGFQKGVATGGPGGLAHIRQKREGKDEYMDGEAERIEYDSKAERTQFFNRAYVKSGEDQARGQYIAYDGITENYTVTSGPEGTVAKPTAGRDARVHVVIQPKNKEGTAKSEPARPADPAPLRTAPEIANPRQESQQ